jgi:iron complex transport system substrate-binding protein
MVWNISILGQPNRYWEVLRASFVSIAMLLAFAGGAASAAAITFKDIRGRTVTLEAPATRIAVDDSRYLIALALIHPDPAGLLAAWPKDVNRLGGEAYKAFLAKSPSLEKLPLVPSSAQDFSVEAVLAAAPEVAVFADGSGPTDAQVAQLESAGVQVVFIDFFRHPFRNLGPSLKIFGAITGRDPQAAAFVAFREERMKAISGAVAGLSPEQRPTVFLEAHAGMSADCCNAPGRGNVGDYIEFVGGHNIAADVLKQQASGRVNLEYVIERDPQVYIATGGPHLEKAGGLVLGPGYSQEQAQAALRKVSSRPGISSLTAVKEGRMFGFAHQLINSPLDIIAVEVFARWIHPDLFGSVDPAKTLDEINTRFLAVPLPGEYWLGLN